jgi:hypothetical protein
MTEKQKFKAEFKAWFNEAIKVAKKDWRLNIKDEKETFTQYFKNGLTIHQAIQLFFDK